MKKFFVFLPVVFFVWCHASVGQEQPSQLRKIIIIRHAEKPENGDNLSCTGFNRALQLPAVLNKKFGEPNYIFVPSINTGKSTSTARMYQTILPFAVKYNLNINTRYDVNDTRNLVQDILKRSGTVLLVWEHKHIDDIVKALGAPTSSKWPDDDFDSIWIVSFINGKAVVTKDKEGIHPAPDCK